MHDHDPFLVDCGEGTQVQLLRYRMRISKLKHIFISHLHGDHYYGLPGLLTSMSLGQRTEPLYLYGPRGLDEILTTHFRYSDTRLTYPLHFQETNPVAPEVLVESEHLTISSFPLRHRIACTGFLFAEKPRYRNLIREKVPADASHEELHALKLGQDVRDAEGNIRFAADDFTLPPAPSRRYAFCSDTLYLPELAEHLEGVDLLYHEATFGEELRERALRTYHSTAAQAAQLASDAGAKELLLGHFSSRYKDILPLLDEAQKIFPSTLLAEEGRSFPIGYRTDSLADNLLDL